MQFFALVLLAAALPLSMRAADALGIMRQSCAREERNVTLRRQYTWRQHNDIRQTEKSGSYKQRENKVFDVFFIDRTEYRRLIEKDGKPLPEKDARDEQARIDRAIEKHRQESEADRRKRREKDEKELAEDRRVRAEVAKAYDFQLLGEEPVNGRPCWKIRAEPKPGYRPPFGEAKWLPKVHGTVWVDQENYEWAKIDAESLDSFSAGLGLLRIGKGFHFLLEQQFMNGEMWAPTNIHVNANARALFLLGGNFDVRISFKDYRKYSVSSTVTAVTEGQQ